MELEVWRAVVGFEGYYEVSGLGRVRTVERWVPAGQRGGRRLVRSSIRKAALGSSGYLQVTLQRRTFTIHSLVAAAFLGPRPDGFEVCHGPNGAFDNRLTNLRYDTVSANRRDTVAQGNHRATQRTHCPKGHAYDEANTAHLRGARRCRTCHRDDERERNRRARAQWPMTATTASSTTATP